MPRSGPNPTTWDNVRAEGAELLLDAGGRAMGNTGAQDTEGRRALVPEVQRRVDLATAHVDRPRWAATRDDPADRSLHGALTRYRPRSTIAFAAELVLTRPT